MMSWGTPRRRVTCASRFAMLLWLASSTVTVAADAQTLGGRLLGRGSNRPIGLAIVTLVAENTGDMVAATVTDDLGRFSLTSPEPGSFLLRASAFGYGTSTAGSIFNLGPDGEMTVDFRIDPRPVALDGLVVSTHRLESRHNLIASGFLARLNRGLGHFITPFEIENSRALSTVELFEGIPGVSLMKVYGRSSSQGNAGHMIVLRGTSAAALCFPKYYLDGAAIDFITGELNTAVPLSAIEAIEIYSGPSEIPVQYSMPDREPGGGWTVPCGVVVLWTRSR